MAITASPWPTPSCRSCAIRSCSSVAARATRSASSCRRARSSEPTVAAATASAVTPMDCPRGCHQPTPVVAARTAIPTTSVATEAANHGSQRRTGTRRAVTNAPRRNGR